MRRYEHPHPGSLIHLDVKKLDNIPDGGGWRFVGRQQGNWNRQATPGKPRNKYGNELMKHAFVHTVIDDYSWIACAEVHDDETALTAVAVLVRAVAWFAARGITVERVLSDNGSAYRSHLWTDVCGQLGITVKKPRPRRPQTKGKIERFHRTMADGWAYARCYTSKTERRNALTDWIHFYNHHRPHSACGNQPPFTRLTKRPQSVQLAGTAGRQRQLGSGLSKPPMWAHPLTAHQLRLHHDQLDAVGLHEHTTATRRQIDRINREVVRQIKDHARSITP